jgi:hypothetical protein
LGVRVAAAIASGFWIDERNAQWAWSSKVHLIVFSENPAVSGFFRSCVARRFYLLLTKQLPRSELANDCKTMMSSNLNRQRHLPARSKRWTSSAARPEPIGSQNARRNYERYLALARAEAQIGNTVGAENYYQYAEHYFRSMSSDSESKSLATTARRS